MGVMPHQPRHVGVVRALVAWLVDIVLWLVVVGAVVGAAVVVTGAAGLPASTANGLVGAVVLGWALLSQVLMGILSPRGATPGSALVGGRFVDLVGRRLGWWGMTRAWTRRTLGVIFFPISLVVFITAYTGASDGPDHRLVNRSDLGPGRI